MDLCTDEDSRGYTADDIKKKDVIKATGVDSPTNRCIIGDFTGADIPFDEIQDASQDLPEDSAVMGVLDIEFAKIYLPILRTLWAFDQAADIVGDMAIPRSPLVTFDETVWYKEKKDLIISMSDPSPPPSSNSLDKSVCEELCHLSQSIKMDRNQRFASEDNDEDANTGKKKWNKLEETYKKIILFASTSDGNNPAAEPTYRFISLLSGGTAAIVSRLFRTWHNKVDIIVQPGMATTIGKGVVTSFPSAFDVNTFSPIFTPPSIAGFTDISNTDETKLELSLKSSQGLSEQQKNQLTSTKPFVPTQCHILICQLENFHLVLCDIFGIDSFIYKSVGEFIDTFKNNDMLVNHSFHHFPFFGAWALNTVHYKVQSFLHACAGSSEVVDIKFSLYEFDDEIQAILTRQSHLFVKPP